MRVLSTVFSVCDVWLWVGGSSTLLRKGKLMIEKL